MKNLDEYLLCQVFGVLLVAAEAEEQIIDTILVPPYKLIKRLRPAFDSLVNELSVIFFVQGTKYPVFGRKPRRRGSGTL